MQLIINQRNKQVICTEVAKGRQHDFSIFKNSTIKVLQQVQLLADKGYQGIHHYHTKSSIPYKKPRNGQLTIKQKQHNKEQCLLLSSGRKCNSTPQNIQNLIKSLSQ